MSSIVYRHIVVNTFSRQILDQVMKKAEELGIAHGFTGGKVIPAINVNGQFTMWTLPVGSKWNWPEEKGEKERLDLLAEYLRTQYDEEEGEEGHPGNQWCHWVYFELGENEATGLDFCLIKESSDVDHGDWEADWIDKNLHRYDSIKHAQAVKGNISKRKRIQALERELAALKKSIGNVEEA
jgi:hypothetical protein